MKLKIISDGNLGNTQVIDVETGRTVDNIKSIYWDIAVGAIGTAFVEIAPIDVDIIGQTEESLPIEQ